MEFFMMLSYVVGIMLSSCCITNMYAMERFEYQELFPNRQEFLDISFGVDK